MSKNILGIFDGGDIESITALISTLEKSSFDYLRLEGDGMKIVIGKNGVTDVSGVCAPAPQAVITSATVVPANDIPAAATNAPAAVTSPAQASIPPVEAISGQSGAAAVPAEAVSEQAGIFIVKSPSYGIFYAQSEPGAPTYVKLGDTVKAGDTLGLVEIMKTFNAISSEVAGEIVSIHVQNQEVLEPDQPMFSIKLSVPRC